MVKKILGVAVITILIVIAAINIFDQKNDTADSEENEYNVTGDTNTEGAYIISDDVGLKEGNKAPDFELETLSGETIKLSDLEGKKVILNFWATWCPPCREEMPEMQKFYDEYQDEVEIIAVNATATETKEQDVYDYMDEFSYTYPILLDQSGDVTEEYEVLTMPTSYFIGTDGKLQQPVHMGPMNYKFMEERVRDLK